MKIRSKLILQFIFISAAIFLTALFFIYRQFQHHIEEEFFNLLESKSRMTAEMVLSHEDNLKPIPNTKASTNTSLLPAAGNTSIYNNNFIRVFTLNFALPETGEKYLKQIQKEGNIRFDEHGFQSLGLATNSQSGKDYYIITSDKPDYSKLSKLRNILALSFLIVMVAIALGGWYFAGLSLRPVERIVKEVEQILPSNLSRRVQIQNQKDELAHLVSTFNNLLDRIEQAFAMERSFISNVSHELKNPLASMNTQIQVTQSKERNPMEYNHVLSSLKEDVEDMTSTVDKLLQLAKFYSSEKNLKFSHLRIDELIYLVRTQLKKNQPEYNIKIEIANLPENEEELYITGNDILLETAFYNLMENGCKFSNDKTVKIQLSFNVDHKAEILISNQSIPLSKDELNHLFDPFFRSIQHTHIKGSGIGLSIVKSIFDLHKISIIQTYEEQLGMIFKIKINTVDF